MSISFFCAYSLLLEIIPDVYAFGIKLKLFSYYLKLKNITL